MDEQTIHVVAHYDSKTDQLYVNVFEDGGTADEWSSERKAEDNVDAIIHKVVDLPEGFADGTVEQWKENR